MIEDDLFSEKTQSYEIFFRSDSENLLSNIDITNFKQTTEKVPISINTIEGQFHVSCWYDDPPMNVSSLSSFTDIIEFKLKIHLKILLKKALVVNFDYDEDLAWGFLKLFLDSRELDLSELVKDNLKNQNFKNDIIFEQFSGLHEITKLNLENAYLYQSKDKYIYLRLLRPSREINAFLKAIMDFQRICLYHEPDMASININSLLNDVEYPVAIIDINLGLVYCNDNFTKTDILPKDLLNLREKGHILTKDSDYSFVYSHVNEKLLTFVLKKREENFSHSKGQELGIITGSIAHELNNPVAGILAAITLLELEKWDSENIKLLKELKESTLRCKTLIDTFLGFSKTGELKKIDESLGGIIKQSIYLVRYRMIESGYSLKIDVDDEVQLINIHSSVLTMVLYIIFNEIITSFTHQSLIQKIDDKVIPLRFMKDKRNLNIVLEKLEFSERDKKKLRNKLIEHLLNYDNTYLDVEKKRIVLKGIFE